MCDLLHEAMTNHGKDASDNGQSQERSVHKVMLPGETEMFTPCIPRKKGKMLINIITKHGCADVIEVQCK